MSEGMNKVLLLGHVGADPELRYTQGGKAVLNIRLATSERYQDRNGEWKDRTEWHSITVWDKRAEALSKIVVKGSGLFIEGSLRTSSFDDRDGNKRYKTEIHAQRVLLTGRGGASGGGDSDGGYGGDGGGDEPPARTGGYGGAPRGGGGGRPPARRAAPPRARPAPAPAPSDEGGGYDGGAEGGDGEGGGYGGGGGSDDDIPFVSCDPKHDGAWMFHKLTRSRAL